MALRAWMIANILDDIPRSLDVDVTEQARQLGIDERWLRFLDLNAFEYDQLKRTTKTVFHERRECVIHPDHDNVHRWSRLCGPDDVKVVILGQDPYPNDSACGIAFGTVRGRRPPPSLLNVFKELRRSMPDFKTPDHGCLDPWCAQGVLLLNTVFTVRAGKPGSHEHVGWNVLSNKILSALARNKNDLVFMLWGNHAQEKEYLLGGGKHLILKSYHPSPCVTATRYAFVGNGHFVKANQYLFSRGKTAVDWNVLVEEPRDDGDGV
ncbi:GP114 [Caviid betaherpesvirus 2]|uniref:GP114 n=1 Tax=Guinea pig cytomegalovirus (strain 22122) TaxID=103920 RepID=E9RHB3_GPCMV|nr:GP114 [Caviid betaherpesvirus 2]AGE11577.1 GP114 [Caviid betaherpesvirus 2]AIL83965.1 GP114 [BAC cloning vector GPN13BACdenovo_preserved(MM)]BAJ78565.1 GP114 [Caviid betaherpesvirus 2]